MIEKLKDIELEYVRCFSKEKNYGNYIEFIDSKFRNTYTGNVIILNKDMRDSELVKLINREIRIYKNRRKKFLNFEVNEEIKEHIIEKLTIRPDRVDKFDYLMIRSDNYISIKEMEGIALKKVSNRKEFKAFIDINLKDYAPILGKSYSMQRIKRKVQAYKDSSNELQSYILYNKEIPVGSCEMLIKNSICKVEDFGILKEYRRRGFGTAMIREILKNNYENGIKYTYVITEKNGYSQRLYKRLGFIKEGEKTQLIW